jgi:isoleucyl-tRNA synthetase
MAALPDEAAPTPGRRLAELQERVQAFWDAHDVAARALKGRANQPVFRFTEGPPTANGVPGFHHVLSRALKDVALRYRRMRGYRIESTLAGWDCHGLPVEVEVEKKHGFRSKRDIETYGVEKFCDECRGSVLEYIDTWRAMSRRLGYWLDYDRAYLTMSSRYIESVWWSLKTLFDRGLLEKGFYSLPYCPRCETPLSSHEVAQGYKELTDPSVTVWLEGRSGPTGDGDPVRLLVWTTTPWTLPANLLVAVRADLPYVGVRGEDGFVYVLAEGALPRYFPGSPTVLWRRPGHELAGWTYRPLFAWAGEAPGRYRLVLDDSVGEAEGTGLVHIAPSFGPDDHRIGEREGVGLFDPLDSKGVFTDLIPPVRGKSFKHADPVLIELLRSDGHLYRDEKIRHTYPTCWRCGTPLLYRALDSWFVRTARLRSALQEKNEQVRWIPAHMQHGRFGNFLEEVKDWALSRNRYWGTPLPIWRCANGHFTCVGSFDELARRRGSPLPGRFDPHRVETDRIVFPCPTCRSPASREPYTIDAWYDSGSSPFAQYHYPFEARGFDPAAPLDFVAEGLDQTRGWFYSLLVLATALFDRPAYRTCLVNGLVLDEAGQKMSKSRGNVLEPMALMADLGGDALRWGMYSMDYTESARASTRSIQLAAQRTLGTLLHVYEFYRSNAEVDRLPPRLKRPTPSSLLDRWLLDRLTTLVADLTTAVDAFDFRRGAQLLGDFVDVLSTWYLRRSRPRFWSEGLSPDRREAHATLSYVLFTLSHLFAPFVPFVAEFLFQETSGAGFRDGHRSIHLRRWPEPGPAPDAELAQAMEELRTWVEIGRELRQRAGVKARMPLGSLVLRTENAPRFLRLGPEAVRLLTDELNVKELRVESPSAPYRYPESDWVHRDDGEGWVALLPRTPSPEHRREGLFREIARRLQQARKELRLAFTDPIDLSLWATGELYGSALAHRPTLSRELLAPPDFPIARGEPPADARRWEIDGEVLGAQIGRRPAPAIPLRAVTARRRTDASRPNRRARSPRRPARRTGRARPPATARRRTGGRPSRTSRRGAPRRSTPARRQPRGAGAPRPRQRGR